MPVIPGGSRALLRELRKVMAGAGDGQQRLDTVVRLVAQNMVAEGLLKRMGHEATQRPGSWPSGAAAVEQWIREELPQVSGSSVRIADGSGLSRRNRLSSELLVGLLRRLYRDEERRGLFLASLAVAGEDGTLHDRMRRGFTGAVLAKSGYIRSVSALSGYVIHPANGLVHQVITADITFDKVDFVAKGREVLAAAGGKVVDHAHLVPPLKEFFHKVDAEKTGAAGNEKTSHREYRSG